ncbi:hypothetical protein CHU32_13120 [Superficieibacter electus]|uniref:Uncharacterized protein n=1 Tax=Superficieibacter electus TaxID=2022662 RepID=A0A2P5GQ34_9ENTR|nr:hypothetical protein [Superficieibacter electus]POP45367.1 hypothetical protein CHU33_10195 [Superficieibacter electus]POP48650.1 hypothetical protein CHU32_13120 [Superficieibacter electus]
MRKNRKEALTVEERCRAIFGDEPPVRHVWEPEFDYADKELQALAATDWRDITGHQLSGYYVLNLVYNEPMQPELFRYLFPLCLAKWRETLLTIGYGDHFEESLFRALRRPYLWREMMDASQRQQVRAFIVDTMLARMDNERGFGVLLSWLPAFNDIGGTAPVMRIIWSRWWSLDSVGKAVCALQYAAHLIYSGDDNILGSKGGCGCGWHHPLSHTDGWSQENWAFLCEALTPQTILEGVQAAAEKLRGEPEEDIAARIARDALDAAEIIEIQIEDVLTELAC